MATKLECPICHTTIEITGWNEKMKEAVVLGVADQLFPENIQPEDWEQYRNEHGGRCDCPECGNVALIEDMEAY